jgi:predicted transcriptional regulator
MQFIVSKFHVYKVFNTLKDAKKFYRENNMSKISVLQDGKLVGIVVAR